MITSLCTVKKIYGNNGCRKQQVKVTLCVRIKKFGNSKDAKEVLEGEVFYTIPDRMKWFGELWF